MHTWAVQDAKARFSELLDRCLAEGPQMVTRRGTEAAVLVPVDEWRRLRAAARPSLKDLLLSDEARAVI
ncbi:MAG: type II toxin-antitoxin system Phd/YefM family antitoxin, partial [Rubrivivax sp.]|nr:type II toxin-antitoxin system Phd/YefM family antitoxin [Rubrivivax sp.]